MSATVKSEPPNTSNHEKPSAPDQADKENMETLAEEFDEEM